MLLLNHEIRLFLLSVRQSTCQISSPLPDFFQSKQAAEIDTLSKYLLEFIYALISERTFPE